MSAQLNKVIFVAGPKCRRWLAVACFTGLGLIFPLHTVAEVTEASSPSVAAQVEETRDWAKERQFWSFHGPTRQGRPTVKDTRWPAEPLDYFILSRLEKANLTPSPEASRRVLIRRVTFDLTGLPPTPAEIDAFLEDQRSGAYERLVDRLMASPRFGEHLASLWLPLARYAEDQAHQVGDDTAMFYPNAYRYRAWVVEAFNRNLPYDQFLRLQLAADFTCEARSNDLAALGFLGIGPKYYNRNRLDVMADEWEDRVDTVARTMLGLTVACARCHDHKFDPITSQDYYALAGVFASTKWVNKSLSGQVVDNKANADKMPPDTLHIVEEGTVTNLNVLIRGNVDRKGPLAERRFLSLLSAGAPKPFKEGSGRKELAEAIACRDNPLTARVMVNRLWGQFFGQPLVSTPSNFGHSGQPPTYPQLLDDLAIRFMDNGWSIKTFVREVVLSSTYRQDSQVDALKKNIDASNQSLWRMNRRRLSIEQWRDAVLFTSGTLDVLGGKSLELDDPNNHHRTVYARISRLKLNDLLMQFDYPDANVHAEKRATTTTATQKLFLLNSPFMIVQAKALAARLQSVSDDTTRILQAYRLLFGREPEQEEIDIALNFLHEPNAKFPRWEQYAQMLLASNEMMYVD